MITNGTKFMLIALATVAVSLVIALFGSSGKGKENTGKVYLNAKTPFVNSKTISGHLQ
jgi:hypothetical protein